MKKIDEDILILAIESSCDETAAAVVKNGRFVLSNIISSQIDLHTLYGGVVPEIASRKHMEQINQVVEQALEQAHVTLADITAVAVTYGPGLVGALLVGVAEAKAIAYAAKKPLVGVHHIEGHISANYIENPDLMTDETRVKLKEALSKTVTDDVFGEKALEHIEEDSNHNDFAKELLKYGYEYFQSKQ